MKPLLTLGIACYNVAPYVQACVDSIAVQWQEGVEVLAVNDGSTDGTAEALRELAAKYPWLSVLDQCNQGLSQVRNRVQSAAKGEYLWHLDGDDVLVGRCIDKLIPDLREIRPDLLTGDFRHWDEVRPLRRRFRTTRRSAFAGSARVLNETPEKIAEGIFLSGHLHVWTKIAKLGIWRAVNFEAGRVYEDIAATTALVLNVRTHWHSGNELVHYRQRSGSITHTVSRKAIDDLVHGIADANRMRTMEGRKSFAMTYFFVRTLARAHRMASALPPDERGGISDDVLKVLSDCVSGDLGEFYGELKNRRWFLRMRRIRQALNPVRDGKLIS